MILQNSPVADAVVPSKKRHTSPAILAFCCSNPDASVDTTDIYAFLAFGEATVKD